MIEYYRFLVVGAQEFQTKARASAGLRGLFRGDFLLFTDSLKRFAIIFYRHKMSRCGVPLLEQAVSTLKLRAFSDCPLAMAITSWWVSCHAFILEVALTLSNFSKIVRLQ